MMLPEVLELNQEIHRGHVQGIRVQAAVEASRRAFLIPIDFTSPWVSQRGLAFPQSCPEDADTRIPEIQRNG